MKHWIFAFFALILTACGSNPASYLPSGTTPIINVEADIAEKLDINAQPENLSIRNLNIESIKIVYKLFWYDIDGVTQGLSRVWQSIELAPQNEVTIPLEKPTEESANYRIYLRAF